MSVRRMSLLGFVTLALVACGEDGSSGLGGSGLPGSSDESEGPSGGEGSSGGPVPTGACAIRSSVSKSTTWGPSECPDGYLLKYETRVSGAGVTLKIEPGTVIKHQGSAMLVVEEGAALIAEGTPNAKIRFTSLQGAVASYRGIRITSDNVENRIAHAVIEHAGSSEQTLAALTLAERSNQSGRLALSDTEIVDNARIGFAMFGNAKLTKFERVKLERNTMGAAHVEAPLVSQLRGAGNTFASTVFVEISSLRKLTQDTSWPSVAPATYRLVSPAGGSGEVLQVQSHLEIDAGTVIEIAPSSGILVAGAASGLKAVGTADQKIVFRGVSGSGWQGITFGETTWSENRLENVEIHNASKAPSWGYYGTGSAAVRKAGLLLGYNLNTPVQLALKDFLIAGPNNAPADIAVKNGTTLLQEGSIVGTADGGALNVENF